MKRETIRPRGRSENLRFPESVSPPPAPVGAGVANSCSGVSRSWFPTLGHSLSLSFQVCGMEVMIPSSGGGWETPVTKDKAAGRDVGRDYASRNPCVPIARANLDQGMAGTCSGRGSQPRRGAPPPPPPGRIRPARAAPCCGPRSGWHAGGGSPCRPRLLQAAQPGRLLSPGLGPLRRAD